MIKNTLNCKKYSLGDILFFALMATTKARLVHRTTGQKSLIGHSRKHISISNVEWMELLGHETFSMKQHMFLS